MKVINLKTNHITNPLGFMIQKPKFSFVTCDTTASKQTAAQIQVSLDKYFKDIVFDTGKSGEIDSLAFELPIELKPYTRYYWRVTVWADNGESAASDVAWFETAKLDDPWTAKWITPDFDKDIHPELIKEFKVDKPFAKVRAYVCGLGLYEIQVNGEKAGNEYFTPHFNAYNKWLQYQTYDITDLVKEGSNSLSVLLGNGVYKGRFGFSKGKEIYGDKFALLCEVFVEYEEGTIEIINSDETWKARKSNIIESNIYDGEVYDATYSEASTYNVREIDLGFDRLKARLSLPVVVKEELKVVEVIKTPAGETVLDFGQNMVGWVSFKTAATAGTVITLQYGEVLQEGNFYRENLRSAKAEYKYISNGKERIVRPYFTYYGFRYVKVTGWHGEINPEDFTGNVLYSDMDQIGYIETSDPLVNRLFLNALWGQKGNFLDVPTDCPQRDERLGWTGDAQAFSGTACFNMDSYAFFNKYVYDMGREQEDTNGMVPMVVPSVKMLGGGSSAWGDAATIIPWNVYLQYGDKSILEQQFESMKAWVEFIRRTDESNGSKRLWTKGYHFGDWLALDGEDPNNSMGGTDISFIASAFYSYSSEILSKAAKVLGKDELAEEYRNLSLEIKSAIKDEYFTNNGRIAVNTQTALVVSLFMDLAPKEHRQRVIEDLRSKLKSHNDHLKTGFVGTPYICRVLSENGCNDLAYTLLLNKDYPSWLYAVTMGATTIWERWNSILPDGKISSTGMNSLNHYAYGSIVEWMYRNAAGINPVEDKPGFRHVKLAPRPDYRLKYVKAILNSVAGLYESYWSINDEGLLNFKFTIPFNATATAELPDAKIEDVYINGRVLSESGFTATQRGETLCIELTTGVYEFKYMPTKDYIKRYSTYFSIGELWDNEEVRGFLMSITEIAGRLRQILKWDRNLSIREAVSLGAFSVTTEFLDELDKKLRKY